MICEYDLFCMLQAGCYSSDLSC